MAGCCPDVADSAGGCGWQRYLAPTCPPRRGGFVRAVGLRPSRGTHRPVAYTLLKWAKDHGCRQIVPLEGLPAVADLPISGEPQVWGVGSTDRARAELEKREIPQLESGMIAGVTGVLLNEGRWRDVDVIALLAEARLSVPDATAAVSLVRVLDTLLPEISIDLEPLQHQAKLLEAPL